MPGAGLAERRVETEVGGASRARTRLVAVARARAADACRMVLDVRMGNDDAKRLYERLGMVVIGRSPGPTLPGVHRVYRMGLALT